MIAKTSKSYDVVLVGTKKKTIDYVGSRTYYLENIFKKYRPDLEIGVYEIDETDDSKRINIENCKNIIFLPWSETINLGWCDFLLSSGGRKILYTENYYWYQQQKDKILEQGFNLENLFNIIAFSSREFSGWWNSRQYKFWGAGFFNELFENLSVHKKKENEKIIFIDNIWTLDSCREPYNALRILNECIPKIKKNHPEVRIIVQNFEAPWVDENLEKDLDLSQMIDYYSKSDVFIVSHIENCGLPQFEAQLCGTKIVTTKEFSNNTALLAGIYNRELWEFENGEELFIKAVEKCLEDYDHKEVKTLALQAFNDKKFLNNVLKDLWGVNSDS